MSGSWAIAAGHELTAAAGAEVLAAGGSAADAAIAAAAMAMVTEPVLAGLYGGGFLLLREPAGRARVLDMFVDTPQRKISEAEADIREIHADFGDTTQAFRIGAGTVATSPLAAGLAEAHRVAGRMPFRELLAPAGRAARDGVAITAFQASLGTIVAPILIASPETRALFCADGAPLGEGKIYRNPDFADVLDEFGREGPRFVLEGEVAGAIGALMAEGGHLTRTEIAGVRPVWREPLDAWRGTVRMALNPAPALGGALTGLSLEILPDTPNPAEIMKSFVAVNHARSESGIDSDAMAGGEKLRALLPRYRDALAPRPAAMRGTTHISVHDRDGAAAALTLSNGEGCGLIAPGTGIMPNNMLGEDDLVPGGPFAWTPGQRLASMMCPMTLDWADGRMAVLGSGGSNRIRTALAQVALQLIDGARLEDAIAGPRLHVEGPGAGMLDYELDGLTEEAQMGLLSAWADEGRTARRDLAKPRGWPRQSMFFGGVHGVLRETNGALQAAGDARRGGAALVG